jgi:hypothetical protein
VTKALAIVAATVLAASSWVGLSATWFLSCTVHGQELGGIDCLQANALPQTQSTPASWFGFLPLALAWLAAAVVLVVIGLNLLVRRWPSNPTPDSAR